MSDTILNHLNVCHHNIERILLLIGGGGGGGLIGLDGLVISCGGGTSSL